MLTPKEIHEFTFRTGRGYKKEDVDSFMQALYHDYELMYNENVELKDKVNTLSDGLQYYKNLEKTLQKSLILAEKTSEDTKEAAKKEAGIIERQAKLNADMILTDARNELVQAEGKINELKHSFELYKTQFRQIVKTQLDILDSDSFQITVKEHNIELYSDKEHKIKPDDEIFKEPDFTEVLKLDGSGKAADEDKEQFADEIPMKSDGKNRAVKDDEEDIEKQEKVSETSHRFLEQEESADEKTVQEKLETEESEAHETEKEPEKDKIDFQVKEKGENVSEDDIEIKMLQKLLNDIKRKNDPGANEEEFEFISSDSEE